MTQPDILELAKQGDAKAIERLISQWLDSPSILVKASLENDGLEVKLESAQIPVQQPSFSLISDKLSGVGFQTVKKVKILGQRTGNAFSDWEQEFDLEGQVNLSSLVPKTVSEVESSNSIVNTKVDTKLSAQNQLSFFGSLFGTVVEATGTVGSVAVQASSIVAGTAGTIGSAAVQASSIVAGTAGTVAGAAVQVSQAVVGTVGGTAVQASSIVAGTAGAVGGAAVQASQTLVGTVGGAAVQARGIVAGAGETVGSAAMQASQAVVGAAVGAGEALGSATIQATKGAGYVVEIINKSPLLQKLTKALKVDWLVKFIDAVDILQAETEVREIQEQYPNEQPSEIAHRLIVKKAVLAAGAGLASNLLPGTALAMLGADLAATTALSAELVYQIAAAYGHDLQFPERKGEALAIFGLSCGGNLAIEAGLGLLGNIPVAGALIGASSNAVMIYALGYAACRFYEAKISSPLIMEATLEEAQTESENYLENAIAQAAIMDQILVHVVLAGNPGKTWEEILPELQAANLSPASRDAIAANINSPLPLETLLEQVNSDFAAPLLAQCEKIVQLDGIVTPEEAKLIETITNQLGINLNSTTEEEVKSMHSRFLGKVTKLLVNYGVQEIGKYLLQKLTEIIFEAQFVDKKDIGELVDKVDQMTGEQFEDFLSICFKRLGYEVKTTPKTNDFGADLILTKQGLKTVVQAKRYQNNVGSGAVQEVVGAVKYYGANSAIVITNSRFTLSAYQLARPNGVELWDREKLIDLIIRAKNIH